MHQPSTFVTTQVRDRSIAVPDLDRLALIRFPMALLIVFYHNDRAGAFTSHLQDAPAVRALIEFIACSLGSVRLPVFFLMAGYAFFHAGSPTAAWFARKLRSRTRSVLLPLVAWNVLALACLAVAHHVPMLARLLRPDSPWSAPMSALNGSQWLQAIIGAPEVQPLVYPLWFLRDLFTMVLLTPLVLAAIRWTRGGITPVLAAVWVAGIDPWLVDGDALMFFVLGCHLAIDRKSLFALDGWGPACVAGWVLLLSHDVRDALGPLRHQVCAVVGLIAALYVTGLVARGSWMSGTLRKAGHYSFFIFVAHEPLLTFVRKGLFVMLDPRTPAQLLWAYLASSILVIVALLALFETGERHAPRVLAFMTGQRSST